MTRILGIDFGTKRLGLALGDPTTGVAVPLDVLELNGADPVALLQEMIAQDGYDHIVVGDPVDSPANMRDAVLMFAKRLEEASGVPVSLVDEHLTSKVADALSKEHGGKTHDDALAAMFIVEAFLNL